MTAAPDVTSSITGVGTARKTLGAGATYSNTEAGVEWASSGATYSITDASFVQKAAGASATCSIPGAEAEVAA